MVACGCFDVARSVVGLDVGDEVLPEVVEVVFGFIFANAVDCDFAAAVATTGSPSYSTASRSGYHVYTFTGSGSITF